jgi:hypothetical protein
LSIETLDRILSGEECRLIAVLFDPDTESSWRHYEWGTSPKIDLAA